MTGRLQLPLPVALLLENLRTSGESDEVLLNCLLQRDFSYLHERIQEPQMDLDNRAALAEDLHIDWERAILEGYEFGFLHMNGLKRLLAFRFKAFEHSDYTLEGIMIKALKLAEPEIAELKNLIYRQWDVYEGNEAADGYRYVTIISKSGEL